MGPPRAGGFRSPPRPRGTRGWWWGSTSSPSTWTSLTWSLIQSDVRSPELPLKLEKALPRKADVVLSDLSPQVMGTWDLDHYRQIDITMAAAALMGGFLRKGGNAMFKVFDGERFGETRATLSKQFTKVQVTKPKASRKGSAELYLVCFGFL